MPMLANVPCFSESAGIAQGFQVLYEWMRFIVRISDDTPPPWLNPETACHRPLRAPQNPFGTGKLCDSARVRQRARSSISAVSKTGNSDARGSRTSRRVRKPSEKSSDISATLEDTIAERMVRVELETNGGKLSGTLWRGRTFHAHPNLARLSATRPRAPPPTRTGSPIRRLRRPETPAVATFDGQSFAEVLRGSRQVTRVATRRLQGGCNQGSSRIG